MGDTSWSSEFYQERQSSRSREGKVAFSYSASVAERPVHEQRVHEKMDPKGVTRESRDSDLHPESNAIAVMFDVTGSMGRVPLVLQTKLPSLMDTLLKGNYIQHPQVLYGAVGDARSDRGSLQVGQWESGVEMDESFENMWLEGGGGGSMEESYQNALYFFARHTSIDCFEKRQKKGYLFLIGDERPYGVVSRNEIEKITGDTLQGDIPIEQIIEEVRERYHLFFIIPQHTSHGRNPVVRGVWTRLLGEENLLCLEDESSISETIAMAIGLCEGAVNLDQARQDLQTHGANLDDINRAAASLSSLAANRGSEGRTARL